MFCNLRSMEPSERRTVAISAGSPLCCNERPPSPWRASLTGGHNGAKEEPKTKGAQGQTS
jgi:hypothetical protein